MKGEFPPLVFWYATEKCDMECKHCCYPNMGRKELTTHQGKKLIEEVAKMGAQAFSFIGGEPLLREDIVELANHCSKEGITPHVITKGKPLTEGLARNLLEVGAKVTLGLDSFTHTTADFICNEARMPKISRRALRICSNYGILKGSVTAALKPNLKEVPSVLDEMPDTADRLVIFGIRPSGKGKKVFGKFAPTPSSYEKFMREIVEGIKKNRWKQEVFVYDPLFLRTIEELGGNLKYDGRRVCQIGKYLDIDSSGNIMPCLFSDLRFGNILERPLEELWNEMKENEFLGSLRDSGNLTGKCGKCEYKEICGGCRTRAFRLTGRWFATDPLCPYVT